MLSTRVVHCQRVPYDVYIGRACLELRGKALGCWCAPDTCHGHVLAELADCEEVSE